MSPLHRRRGLRLRRLPAVATPAAPAAASLAVTAPDPSSWLLNFSDATEGRPWGQGTAMAKRAAAGGSAWDTGCFVEPLIGGFDTMIAIRDSLEAAVSA